MSKHAAAGLIALIAIFAFQAQGPAQDKPESRGSPQSAIRGEGTGYKPGKFLTQDDFEHLQAALAYLDLTPEDLSFEKKHAPHAMLLDVVRQSLDQPLSVPAIAEEAATELSVESLGTRRAMHAGRLLDLPAERWSIAELQKDAERQQKRDDEWRALEDKGEQIPRNEYDALMRRHEEEICSDFFGGPPARRFSHGLLEHRPDSYHARSIVAPFVAVSGALLRASDELTIEEQAVLAGAATSGLMPAKVRLPGASDEDGDVFELSKRIDLASRFVAAARLEAVLRSLAKGYSERARGNQDWAIGEPSEIAGATGNVVEAWEGPWGKLVIGGTGSNVYEGDDFIGIIDLGGDDIYRGRVASAIGLPGRSPLSFVLDLGGNDRFEGGNFTQGFGFLGVGVLMALGEGDNYYSADFCAQGAGLCGVGWLIDEGGNDTFQADSFAQGAGMFGFGHLVNAGGHDVYRVARYAQGFAGVRGAGVLSDGGGNDLYYAGGKYLHQPLFNDRYQSLSQGFAIGNRGAGVAGGVALLLDEGDGNDVFHADIYGQGSSYWYSLGMLVSQGGNDTFTLGQYGQGAGIHLSSGILVNLAGNDTYTNVHGVGTGGAHDWSVGWLIDRAGNDLYQGNGQGQGLNHSFGILLDCGGNDSHSSSHEGNIGKGVNNDISLLLNLAGENSYTPKEVKPGQLTRRGRHAMVYDPPQGWWPGLDTSTLPTVQDPPPQESHVQHILISWDGIPRVEKKERRTKEEAKELMMQVLRKARSKGADWKQLQTDHNEDSGDPHATYTATPAAMLVKPFLDTALRLGVGQIDWCESQYGYHIIKRVK